MNALLKAAGRRLHIVYLLRALPRTREASLVRQVETLESLGHQVSIVVRKRRAAARVDRAFAQTGATIHRVYEDDPLLFLTAISSNLSIALQDFREYRRLLRISQNAVPHTTLRRFLHAGVIARLMQRIAADHLHFLSGHSRVARFVSSMADLSYSITAHPQNAIRRDETRTFVSPGGRANKYAVELLIRVSEEPDVKDELGTAPLVLAVNCPSVIRGALKTRLRQDGFEVEELRSVGADPDSLLARLPDVLLVGAGPDLGADAFRLLSGIREDSGRGQVPFIVVTDRDSATIRPEAFRRGADGVFHVKNDLAELTARIANLLLRRGGTNQIGERPRRTGISGELENLPLPEIVQVLNMGCRTACVTVASSSGQGKIWFEKGALVHARLGPHEGETAFFEILRWKHGDFRIQKDATARKRTIENDTMFLVFEALRRIDEDNTPADGEEAVGGL